MNKTIGIFTIKEWIYTAICFIGGIIILYDFSTNDSLPLYIIGPVDIASGLCLCFLLCRNELNEKQSYAEVDHE